jgi:hypothetical protein
MQLFFISQSNLLLNNIGSVTNGHVNQGYQNLQSPSHEHLYNVHLSIVHHRVTYHQDYTKQKQMTFIPQIGTL